MKKSIEEKFKRKYMKLIDERICELLDHLKRDFVEHTNCEDIVGEFDQNIVLIKELKVLKWRVWKYK